MADQSPITSAKTSMNEVVAAAAPGRGIDLTREADFAIGGVAVRPTGCEVVAGGRSVRLQPRVMQVLVALARADGQLVSREALMEACWGRVMVGDDALNRSIQRLRRVAQTDAKGAFAIETIPRLGYRLTARGVAAEAFGPARDGEAPVTLAVLPFDNLSGDPELSYFSDGVSEEILHAITRGSDLRVVGRTSSFAFQGSEKAIPRVAAQLKATHVLDGSVRRDGPRVRIAAQLIECATQTTLWSDRFDRDLTDIFALQDEIASAVATALRTTFDLTAPVGRIDPAAYDLYLRTRTPADSGHIPVADAIGMLEKAVALAPHLATAWAELAHRRAILHRRTSLDDMTGTVDRADVVTAAEQALRLDPGSGLAQAALGYLLPWGDYRGREAALEKALVSGPRDSRTVTEMGWFLASVGRIEAALRYASQSLELDPLNGGAANLYSQMLGFAGRHDECQRSYAAFRDRWPNSDVFTFAPLNFAALIADWPAFDRLRLAAETGRPNRHIAQALAAGAMLREPTPERRARILEIIGGQIDRTGTVMFGPLVLAVRMGLTDEAFSLIDQASFSHLLSPDGAPPAGAQSPGIIFNRSTTAAMMDDVRFVGFCARIGLCDYWVRTDRWPDCADRVAYDFKAQARRLAGEVAPSGAER